MSELLRKKPILPNLSGSVSHTEDGDMKSRYLSQTKCSFQTGEKGEKLTSPISSSTLLLFLPFFLELRLAGLRLEELSFDGPPPPPPPPGLSPSPPSPSPPPLLFLVRTMFR